MATLKPYYVTLTYSGVVMAENAQAAESVAERYAHDIVSDSGDPGFEDVIELRSLAHLRKIDSSWDGGCGIYGYDATLVEVLPPVDPHERDTRTADMFEQGGKK